MTPHPRDETREERIHSEILVDAYGPEEQASSWSSYLEETLTFPFLARCVAERASSPLQVGDEVEIVGMAPELECRHEMFVLTPWDHGRTLAIPLSQLAGLDTDEQTGEAIEDWQYWVRCGYEL
jgi:Calcium binding